MGIPEEVFESHMKYCRDQRVDLSIFSGTPTQTLVAMAMLFNNAKENISIFSRSLRQDIFADEVVLTAFRSAIRRGCKVDIVTKENVPAPHPILEIENVSLGRLRIFQRPLDNLADCMSNFVVVDKTAFRISKESPVVSGQMDRWAVTNFYDPERATKLIRVLHEASDRQLLNETGPSSDSASDSMTAS